jgi:hypothetical protein
MQSKQIYFTLKEVHEKFFLNWAHCEFCNMLFLKKDRGAIERNGKWFCCLNHAEKMKIENAQKRN